LKKTLRDYLLLFLVAGSIILLDQLSKAWIRSTLGLGEIYRPDLWLTEYARLINWKNYGAAFGMFQSGSTIFMLLSMVVSLGLVYYFPQVPREERIARLAICLLLGGAVGNLIDRLHQGYVTDFISVGDFPVFNVADASISTGVAVLFIAMWMQERAQRRENAAAEAAQAAAADSSDETPLDPPPYTPGEPEISSTAESRE
jgi:signal peptidase II